jgi:hypothetical protein
MGRKSAERILGEYPELLSYWRQEMTNPDREEKYGVGGVRRCTIRCSYGRSYTSTGGSRRAREIGRTPSWRAGVRRSWLQDPSIGTSGREPYRILGLVRSSIHIGSAVGATLTTLRTSTFA